MKIHKAVEEVLKEFRSASSKHEPFNSPHEGHSILREEVEELWDEVKKKPSNQSKKRFRSEAKQVAAMALRFIVDLT